MSDKPNYDISTDITFNPLEVIDVWALQEACRKQWFNQTLCRVNDCVVRLGIFKGEFHWHQHTEEDEFFYVIDGELTVLLENREVNLKAHQGFTVPKGILHKTAAAERTVVLMIEGSTVTPTGDA